MKIAIKFGWAVASALLAMPLLIAAPQAQGAPCSVDVTFASPSILTPLVDATIRLSTSPLDPGTGTVTCSFGVVDPNTPNLGADGYLVVNSGTPASASTASVWDDTLTAFVTASDNTIAGGTIGLTIEQAFNEPATSPATVDTSFSLTGNCNGEATFVGSGMQLTPYVNGSDLSLSNFVPTCSPLSSTGSGTAAITGGTFSEDTEYLEFDFVGCTASECTSTTSPLQTISLPAGVGECETTNCMFPTSVPGTIPSVPEPTTLVLLGSGLAWFRWMQRRSLALIRRECAPPTPALRS